MLSEVSYRSIFLHAQHNIADSPPAGLVSICGIWVLQDQQKKLMHFQQERVCTGFCKEASKQSLFLLSKCFLILVTYANKWVLRTKQITTIKKNKKKILKNKKNVLTWIIWKRVSTIKPGWTTLQDYTKQCTLFIELGFTTPVVHRFLYPFETQHCFRFERGEELPKSHTMFQTAPTQSL